MLKNQQFAKIVVIQLSKIQSKSAVDIVCRVIWKLRNSNDKKKRFVFIDNEIKYYKEEKQKKIIIARFATQNNKNSECIFSSIKCK